ncbi:Gfo/Idh/MocA family protein [Anaeromyxobacter sp. PSR-1]|uniref:Gfo/Idh/MocA family protein n=1 Tax=unclassified Anaeromyxobacter TaxID=2620896 RepID=UPI0005DE0575|nr:Gfo/Idh/MocA family oxidoreductase [Anaeromyxobacter sp. PSR-1]GAO05555.1 putative oxidoreductase YcjS [Anaeromyxobacter sp. PSR-1]
MAERDGTAVRVAVIGCGQIADAHLAQARRAGAEVVAVCDATRHMAEQAAARWRVPAFYEGPDAVDAMLAEARPEVVHVTTPPASHLPLATRALAAGAHVYVEKPVTVDAAEAVALEQAAARHGRLACAGHNLLFDPVIHRLRALVEAGALGEVVHADAVMGYDLGGPFGALLTGDPGHWIHRLPAGLAHNNLSHPLSLVLPLLGPGTPAVAHALGRRLRPERFGDARDAFHDELRILLEGARATASVLFSCRIRPAQLALTVYGTRRAVHASLDARTLRVVEGSHLPGPFQKVDWARRDASAAGAELLRRSADLALARLHYFEGMRQLFAAFYRAARTGGEAPVPLADARAVAQVIDAAAAACRRADVAAQEACA